MTAAKGGTAQLVSGVVVFVVLVAAFVVLTIQKLDTTGLVALGAPVVGALLVTGHVTRVTEDQNAKIDVAARDANAAAVQTNGMLDGRIRAGVEDVLRRNGLLTGDPVETLPELPNVDPLEPSSDGS